jgi:hypothetical protein
MMVFAGMRIELFAVAAVVLEWWEKDRDLAAEKGAVHRSRPLPG